MLAIAGLLCTLWEIMGAVQRGGDAPGVMFHISTSHRCLDRKQLFLSCLPPPRRPVTRRHETAQGFVVSCHRSRHLLDHKVGLDSSDY